MDNSERIDRDLIVIGGSAGALSVLLEMVAALPADLAAAVMVVVHQSQSQPGRLPAILSNRGPLIAEHATDGAAIELGRIYIAPPDHHLLIEPGRIRLSRGPKENRFRPAIDPLFRTASRAYGPQVIGVILSGLLDDGTLGSMRVKHAGGTVIAQDPASADAGDMPASVIGNVACDYILRPNEFAGILAKLVQEPSIVATLKATSPMTRNEFSPESMSRLPSETGDTADRGNNALATGQDLGSPIGLTCPQCGGAVWERTEGGLVSYRCHVGHAFTADAMADDHNSQLESTLWEAVRMFQENAALHRRMEAKTRERGVHDMADRYGERAQEQETRSELMRKLLLKET